MSNIPSRSRTSNITSLPPGGPAAAQQTHLAHGPSTKDLSLSAILQLADTSLENQEKIIQLIQKQEAKRERLNEFESGVFQNESLESLKDLKSVTEGQLNSVRSEKGKALQKLTSISQEMQEIEADRKKRESASNARARAFNQHFSVWMRADKNIEAARGETKKFDAELSSLKNQSAGNIRNIRHWESAIASYQSRIQSLTENEIKNLHFNLIKSGALMEGFIFDEAQEKPEGPRSRRSKSSISKKKVSDEKIQALNQYIAVVTSRRMSGAEYKEHIKQQDAQKNFFMRNPITFSLMGVALASYALPPVADFISAEFNLPEQRGFRFMSKETDVLQKDFHKSGLMEMLTQASNTVKTYSNLLLYSQILTVLLFSLPEVKSNLVAMSRSATAIPANEKAQRTPKTPVLDDELYKFALHIALIASEKISMVLHGRIDKEMSRLIKEHEGSASFSPEKVDKQEILSALAEFKGAIEAAGNTEGMYSPETSLLFKNLVELLNGENEQKAADGATRIVEEVCSKVLAGLAGDDGSSFSSEVRDWEEKKLDPRAKIEELNGKENETQQSLREMQGKAAANKEEIRAERANKEDEYLRMKELRLTAEELTSARNDRKDWEGKEPYEKALDIKPSVANADRSKKAREKFQKDIEQENVRYPELSRDYTNSSVNYRDLVVLEKELKSQILLLDEKLESKQNQVEMEKGERKRILKQEIDAIDKEIASISKAESTTLSDLRRNPALQNLMTTEAINLAFKNHIDIKNDKKRLIKHAENKGYASYFLSAAHFLKTVHAVHMHFAQQTDSATIEREFCDCKIDIGTGIRKRDVMGFSAENELDSVLLPSQASIYDMANGKISHLYVYVPRA